MRTNRPPSVIWFERAAWLYLASGILHVFLNWDAAIATIENPRGAATLVVTVITVVDSFLLLMLWLAARRRKRFAGFVLLAGMTLLLLPSVPALPRLFEHDPFIVTNFLARIALIVLAAWLWLRPAVKAWCAGRWPVDREIFS